MVGGRRGSETGGRAASAPRPRPADKPPTPAPGVILESEDYHLKAYNDAFEYFDCRIGGQRVFWSEVRGAGGQAAGAAARTRLPAHPAPHFPFSHTCSPSWQIPRPRVATGPV